MRPAWLKKSAFLLAAMMTFISLAGEFALDGVKFAYRVPVHSDTTARILVCFGGRNWEGDKTLRAFGFDAVADRHNLYLISPSFQEREYWEPQSWSGNLLLRAIDELRRRCSIPEGKLYLYGYSAGGSAPRTSRSGLATDAWRPGVRTPVDTIRREKSGVRRWSPADWMTSSE